MDIRRVLSCWVLTGLGVALFAADQPASLPFAQLPPAVQKGIQAQLGNGTLGEITRNEEDGVVTYTVEITKGGQTRDYSVDETGALVGLEMMVQETPPAVQRTILAQVGQGTVDSIEKTIDGSEVSYDVEWKSTDGAAHSFSVLESGALNSVGVTLEETPPAVQATVTREVGNAQLKEISKTVEDDGVYYDVTINRNGVDRDFSVAANGRLDSRQVFLSEIPPPAQATIQRTIGNGTLVRIDLMFEKIRNVFPFEVEGVVNGKTLYFNVGPKGAFLGVDQ